MIACEFVLAGLLLAASGSPQESVQKDFNTAEFYRRTNHPGSAYFYYDLLRRRFAGTALAKVADLRCAELLDGKQADILAQAEKDFDVGEFYRRLGQPGSAYFYYSIVLRRYPATSFAEQARQRLGELPR